LHDLRDIGHGNVEVVDKDEEGDDGVFRWQVTRNSGFRIAFVAHLALDHAQEVGAQDASESRDNGADNVDLGGSEGLLEDFVDDVHDVIDGGSDVWWVGIEWFVRIEGEVGRLFVELESFFDRAAEEEGRHGVEGRDYPVSDLSHEGGIE